MVWISDQDASWEPRFGNWKHNQLKRDHGTNPELAGEITYIIWKMPQEELESVSRERDVCKTLDKSINQCMDGWMDGWMEGAWGAK